MPKRTPLYAVQKELNGKFVDFHGWEMPIWFSSIIDEHNTVRNSVGIFDVSHMGEIIVKGNEAQNFVDFLITNNVSKINKGQIVYTAMCDKTGGILDDFLVYKYSEEYFLIVVNASNSDKDYEWIKDQSKGFDVETANVSNEYAQIAFQGPKSEELLQNITEINLSNIGFYEFYEGNVDGIECLVSRTGYTGEDGFEIYLSPEFSEKIYNKLVKLADTVNGKPCGLGCRDTLRFEATYMLYGNDIDENTNPLEAGLKWAVDLQKDFIGKDAILKSKEEGLKRGLRALEIKEKKPVRKGYKIYKDEQEVGFVTSAAKSPTTGKNLALGYINKPYTKSKTELTIDAKGKKLDAVVVKKPFYKGSVKNS